MSKEKILNKITESPDFKAILKAYESANTEGYYTDFNNDSKNGLCNRIYSIKSRNTLVSLIMPIFSSENTITWNYSYLGIIRNALQLEHSTITDEELVSMIRCPLYFLDNHTHELIFIGLVSLSDFLDNGIPGKNGNSVYWWNNKLPNNHCMTLKMLKNEIKVMLMPYMTRDELRKMCNDYAIKHHKKFADITKRSEHTKVNNISDGLYAQLTTYLWLRNEGYNVSMTWCDDDDLGIDIVYTINGTNINIDVKSTKTDKLKITKNREETDFYAVCSWKKNEPQLLGFLFKYNFWQSSLIESLAPEKKNDIFYKKLSDIRMNLVTIDKLFDIFHNYKLLKMKRGQRLFNVE